MTNNQLSDIENKISDLLKKRKKNYLTVTQIRNGLSGTLLKQLGLMKKRSRAGDVLRNLRPYLGQHMLAYKGTKSSYIGFKMTPEEIILSKIRQHPGISPKNLFRNLPMSRKEFIAVLNFLLASGAVRCTFSENYMPRLRIPGKIGCQTRPDDAHETGRFAFKSAYDGVGKGHSFVRIHRVREHLNWSKDRFDDLLRELMADYTIELHGGDPSALTDKEIRNSFTDENGLLYINLTWWGENNE